MNQVLLSNRLSKFSCRACGSKYLPQGNIKKLCEACDDAFIRWCKTTGAPKKSKDEINKWLANRLLIEATRLKKFGVCGRCEAVSAIRTNMLRKDYFAAQCRTHANFLRDGRRVCGVHARMKHISFAQEMAHDAYVEIERLLIDLSQVDERLRSCVINAFQTINT